MAWKDGSINGQGVDLFSEHIGSPDYHNPLFRSRVNEEVLSLTFTAFDT